VKGRTSLSEAEFAAVMPVVCRYLSDNTSITNAQLRALTKLNYDQAIKFFNVALMRGLLERRGRASGTNYVVRGKR
jgi:hypothetical protein